MQEELIQWPRAVYWDKPWNPWVGCKAVSPACLNCYARTSTEDRFSQSFEPHRTKKLNPPKKGVVFCGNMTDLWGEWVSDKENMDIVSKALDSASSATYLFCTKRAERLASTLKKYSHIPHAYFGMTAENQEWFDKRAEYADEIPFRHKLWLSAEPLLGPIDMGDMVDMFKWVAVGCESGQNRRPCNIKWIESIVEQCRMANVPVFVKQVDIGSVCERDITKFPEHLRIRQVPWAVHK